MMIRRLNTRLNNVLDGYGYRRFVRELVVHQHLARRGSTRLALPPDVHHWAATLARSWVSELALRGYDVVGDLDDLRGNATLHPYVDPDKPRERDVAFAAVDAIKALLVETARVRAEEERLRAELEETRAALSRSYLRPSYRMREQTVKGLAQNPLGRGLLSLYRLTRGRSSRSA
jgi:hypothetical protein